MIRFMALLLLGISLAIHAAAFVGYRYARVLDTGSMEPTLYGNDFLIERLYVPERDIIGVGDMIIFRRDGRDYSIVHRIVAIGELCTYKGAETVALTRLSLGKCEQIYFTKGDANPVIDGGYRREQDIIATVKAIVPLSKVIS